MVHGTVKGLLGLISAIVLIILLAAAGLAYRLSQGPLSLSFLTPAFEDSLSGITGGLSIELDDTSLVWDPDHQTLAIRLRNVRALNAAKRVIAAVPAASVSFSGPALLTGRVVLRGVRLIRPHLHMLHTAQGGFALGLGEEVDADAAAAADSAIADTLTKSKKTGDGGSSPPSAIVGLERVEIDSGDLDFDDPALNGHWHAPRVDLLVVKSSTGISLTVRAPIEITDQGKTEQASFSLAGLYHPDTATATGTIHWTGLRPASFAHLSPILTPLGRFQMTTGGVAEVGYSQAEGLTALALDIAAGSGVVDATPWGGALHIAAASVKGKLTDKLDRLVLDDLRIDLGGPKIAATGSATGLNSKARLDFSARIEEVPVDLLKVLWPEKLAPNPRDWITTNLSGGTLHHSELKLVATVPINGGGETVIDSLTGTMQGEGITVHYLGALPPAKNAAATATFDKDSMSIAIKGGVAGGVKVKGGTIKLSGFSAAEQTAAFDLNFESTVPDALKVIDAKPLGFTSTLGFDPSHTKGDATIAVNMSFPMVQTLHLSQVKLKVKAQTKGLGIPKAALGLDLANGDFDIDVDTQGMDIAGKAKLGTIPIDLKWHENFVKAAYASRYQVKALLDDEGRKAVGLGESIFQAPVIDGAIPVEAVATTLPGGKGDVTLKADLGPVSMRLPSLNWSKPKDKPGTAEATLKLNANGIIGIPRFAVAAAGGLDIRGDMTFDASGHARRLTLAGAKWGRTDLKGIVVFKPNGALDIDISGPSFDGSELVAGSGSVSNGHVETQQQALAVTAKLGKVWLSDDGALQNVTANLARGKKRWRFIRIDGQFDKGQTLHVDIKPQPDDRRRALKVTGSDAGATFAAFGLFKNMRGGTLTVDGTYDDTDPKETLAGTLKIENYRVVNAPLLARVFTVASLTGTLGMLSGDGITFDKAEVPFTLADGLLTLKEARTAGTEIGITASGQIDLDNDIFAIQGTIVPAYAINSLVGKIPLIGNLLTGEKGGGLVAFSYSIKGSASDPAISINPLSVLTPGFLKGLFDVFDSGSGTKIDRSKDQGDKTKDKSSADKPPDATDR